MTRTVLLLSLLLAVSASAEALVRPVPEVEALLAAKGWPRHLSTKVAFAYRLARSPLAVERGEHPLTKGSIDARGLVVHLRFSRDVTGVDLERVTALGCDPVRLPDGSAAMVGPVADAHCSWASLEPLAKVPGLLRVTPTLAMPVVRPLGPPASTTLDEVEAPALSRALYPAAATGAGVVVADMDSPGDVFHPFLFRADGGRFAWIDVDLDGRFSPGIDAVDLNKNGAADANETLRMQKAQIYAYDHAGAWTRYNDGSTYIAGVDWLYQDENNDFQRNFGATFGESRPAYGEALFVTDDVDGDGVLDTGERLVRLGSSKIRAVLDYSGGSPTQYTRGSNLSQFSAQPDNALHGSMVMGTIAGGDGRYTRYHGLATDAELLNVTISSTQSFIGGLSWARQQGANIVLWEMATWYFESLDGASDHEAACDAAHAAGVVQVGAAGNLGGSKKHRVAPAPPGSSTFQLSIPAQFSRYVGGNFNFPASAQLSAALTLGAQTIALSGSSGNGTLGGFDFQWFTDTSLRGTQVVSFYMSPPSGQPLGSDSLVTVTLQNADMTPVQVHGYVFDGESTWGQGAYWLGSAVTDRNTYGTPAVGDKTIAIGTYLADFNIPPTLPGDLALHSGRGPRADGMDTIDVVAPEDHISSFTMANVPWGQLWVGGGTSNASPVAVGVLALLKGLEPTLTADQLVDRLRTRTRVETRMGTLPNDDWGRGKVAAHRARFNVPPPAVLAPIARGAATDVGADVRLDASASTDPGGLALTYRWDADGDGVYDAAPSSAAVTTRPAAGADRWITLEVANSLGAASRALVLRGTTGGGAGGGGGSGGGSGGGAAGGGSTGGGASGGGASGGGSSGGGGGGDSSEDGGWHGSLLPNPTLPPPTKGGCGCGASPGEALLLGLAALWLRRRNLKSQV